MLPGYKICYQKKSQSQFVFEEEKACDQKMCFLKSKPKRFLNDSSLQLDFLLKLTKSLFIMRYTINFLYHNPHDWFDLILKEVNVPSEKYSSITEHSLVFHSFYTEIAADCNKTHVLQTAIFIGGRIPTWSQARTSLHDREEFVKIINKLDRIDRSMIEEFNRWNILQNKIMNETYFFAREPIHEQNRLDMLLYFSFSADNTEIDLFLDFKANYDIIFADDGFDIFWKSSLSLNKDAPEYFLSLSAYYESCLIQSKGKVMNGNLTLSWIPYSSNNFSEIFQKDLYYLYQGTKKWESLTWNKASSICETNNSFLPILTSKARQEQLIRLIDYLQLPIIFIGLNEIKASTMSVIYTR